MRKAVKVDANAADAIWNDKQNDNKMINNDAIWNKKQNDNKMINNDAIWKEKQNDNKMTTMMPAEMRNKMTTKW